MILFHGDSFTWGSGLQYHCLVEEYGYTWEECKQFLPDRFRLEHFPKKIDDYRIKHSFANKVSEYFDTSYLLSLNGNGGDNTIIQKRLFIPNEEYHAGLHWSEIDFHIIQLSTPLRNNPHIDINSDVSDLIYSEVSTILYKLSKLPQIQKNNYLFLCWFPEHSEIIKQTSPNNLIYLNYNNQLYDCFYPLHQMDSLTFRQYGLQDGHFTKEGHDIIANSIINKIKENNFKFNRIDI